MAPTVHSGTRDVGRARWCRRILRRCADDGISGRTVGARSFVGSRCDATAACAGHCEHRTASPARSRIVDDAGRRPALAASAAGARTCTSRPQRVTGCGRRGRSRSRCPGSFGLASSCMSRAVTRRSTSSDARGSRRRTARPGRRSTPARGDRPGRAAAAVVPASVNRRLASADEVRGRARGGGPHPAGVGSCGRLARRRSRWRRRVERARLRRLRRAAGVSRAAAAATAPRRRRQVAATSTSSGSAHGRASGGGRGRRPRAHARRSVWEDDLLKGQRRHHRRPRDRAPPRRARDARGTTSRAGPGGRAFGRGELSPPDERRACGAW